MGGWAANGNQGLALARNLGQVLGVFAAFHPNPKSTSTPLDHDYLSANSANIAGLAMAEGVLMRLGPPAWPFPVDKALAEQGRDIFARPAAMGGCAECHGMAEGEERGPGLHTLKTASVDAGTDLRQWQIVLRQAKSGSLEGAVVPGVVGPLKATDLSLNILKAAVTGTLVEVQAAQAAAQAQASPKQQPEAMAKSEAPSPAATITHDDMVMAMRAPEMPAKMAEAPAQAPSLGYEARVLQGIWAAAPYLHNGSVPSLAELLKPAAQRVKAFKVGPAYDIQSVGLAPEQTTGFTLTTTGCENRASGNSNCGHDYGTQLPDADKKALLEYLKTL